RPLGVFCINEGKVKVYKTGVDGKNQIITINKPGDLIGYRAMISAETYPVTAEALEDSKVCFIPKSDFLTILNESPQFSSRLLQEVCKELGVMANSITSI